MSDSTPVTRPGSMLDYPFPLRPGLQARLTLVECTRVVIRNVLDLIRIEAPERM